MNRRVRRPWRVLAALAVCLCVLPFSLLGAHTPHAYGASRVHIYYYADNGASFLGINRLGYDSSGSPFAY